MENIHPCSKNQIKEWVRNQTLSKEETFNFVHHATQDRKYPCDTKIGAGLKFNIEMYTIF